MKPLKLPGEKDPTQAICTCPHCNSCVDQKTHECQNCHKIIVPNMGQPHPRKVPQKGERYDDYGPKLDYIIQAKSKRNKGIGKVRDPELEDDDDAFSIEFDQCTDPLEKMKRYDDVTSEEVMKSCRDLAIDG